MTTLLPRMASQAAIANFLSVVPATVPPDLIITGFPEYAAKLTADQQKLIDRLAERIVASHSGFTSIVAFVVTGHADKDLRENNPERKPGETREQFELRISGARAARAREALLAKIRILSRGKFIHLVEQLLMDPKRNKAVAMGATDRLKENPRDETERKLNRRVEFHLVTALVPDPDPVPPPQPKPDPSTEFPKRATRCIELLQKRNMPSGPVQTSRMKCIMSKLKDNAAANDRFVDGDLTTLIIKEKRVNGLQDILLHYGSVSNEDFGHFFESAKAIILNVPGFATTASDDEAIRAMDQLDRRILKAIGFLDSHMNRFGIASDKTKTRLNDAISKGQADQNSIYSCR